MIFSLRQLFIIIPTFIVAFSILFVKTQTIDVEQYNHVSSILHEIQQYNAEIDQDVLKIRQGLLKHYDTLDELSYKMTNSILRLKEGEDHILGLGNNINQLVLKLDLLVERKKTTLQDYKLNNAVLRNSLDYLPHSLKIIETEMSRKDQVRNLYNVIIDAGLAVLAYASSDELYWADQANINISKSRSLKNNNVEFKKQYIIEHVVIVLKKSTIVKQLITEAANPAIGKTLDTLTEEYNLFYKLREQEAEKYQIGLYALPILLALYIIYVLVQLKQAKDTLEEVNEKLVKWSFHDGLTGIANRRLFDQEIEREWHTHCRLKSKLSIIMCDIDKFKIYNDTYGHQKGDECIVAMTRIIQDTLLRSTDVVARYGGEEFIIMLVDTDAEGAKSLANNIIKKLEEEKIEHNGSNHDGLVTMSFGVAEATTEIKGGSNQLIKNADDALYVSKENGRNRVSVFGDKS